DDIRARGADRRLHHRRRGIQRCADQHARGKFLAVEVDHVCRHPPCRGVMISISSPAFSCVSAQRLFGTTSKLSAIAKCVPSYSSSDSSASTREALTS